MYGYVFQNINGRSRWNFSKILLFLLNETYTDTHSQDSCGKESLKKHWWKLVGKMNQIGNANWFIEKQKLFFSVFVDDIKMAGKKQNLALMWKKLMKDVDIEDPTTFLDHFIQDAFEGNANQTRKSLNNTQKVRVTYFSRSNWKITRMGQPRAKTSAWSCDMEGHARKCVSPNFKRKSWKTNVNCRKFALIYV